MKWNTPALLELGLRVAAIAQFGIAALNLSLVPLLGWKEDLGRLPLLVREVFQVHLIFITVTVAIFAVLTWRFAGAMASGSDLVATWLAIAIGLFWGIRSVMQWTHYSASHWRGQASRTLAHWLLFFGYGSFAVVYLRAGFAHR
ncbi:MAG: hypothetical protein ACR2NX_04455 [Chthoniobacterales bacterium]